MRIRIPVTLTIVATFLAAASVSCKREHRVPTVTQSNAADVVPTTQEADKEKEAKLLAGLEPIPPLVGAVLFKTPDDEAWNRYDNGVLIHDLKSTDGVVPKIGQTVSVIYTGTFPGSNKVFDKNTQYNPLIFRLGSNSVVKGMNIAVSTMHVGGKRRILLPSEFAYGEKGHLGSIGPNQALIFEIELLSVTGEPVELPKSVIPVDEPIGPALPDKPADKVPATKP